jgi:hypothetical protein
VKQAGFGNFFYGKGVDLLNLHEEILTFGYWKGKNIRA